MKVIDPNTLFSIFETGDPKEYEKYDVGDLLLNPNIILGMVVSSIFNYTKLDNTYREKYGSRYEQVRDRIKDKYLTKCYYILLRTQPDKITEDYYSIFSGEFTRKYLQYFLDYFEKIEEYEKCSEIVKFLEVIE